MTKNAVFRWIIVVFMVILAIWAGVNYRHHLDIHQFQATIASFGIWGPVVFIGIYALATVLFLPGSALTITGGLVFGPLLGTVYNLTGAMIGATIAFFIARYVASDWVAAKTGGRLGQLLKGVEDEGWKFVAIVRLVPLIPFNLLNYALGLTKINPLAYIIASIIFMLPGAFAYTYLGSLGETVIHGEAQTIVTRVSIAIGLLIILACIPWLVKRLRKQPHD
ncbi:MAG: TVP38/TMEM64 family protein [Legionellales bacterium]|nr:TVP38/TMEM64 family protein [Legionellales bacterium]|tara:strand:+ start:32619 stop:33284 length:666 start_codon:yes stop_codon:yes gene_type:complete